jgi:hypothetical protein
LHAATLDGDVAIQRCGQAEDDATFHLSCHDVRVYDPSAIDRANRAVSPDAAITAHREK